MQQLENYLLKKEAISTDLLCTAKKLTDLILSNNETIHIACILVLYALEQKQNCFELHWLKQSFWQDSNYDWEAFLSLLESQELSFLHANKDSQEQVTPLVITKQRIYIYRYYLYETSIAEKIQALCIDEAVWEEKKQTEVAKALSLLFPQATKEQDEQFFACLVSASKKFLLLSGAPGTGKTTTAYKIVSFLQYLQAQQNKELFRVCLVAPTGKAASKLNDSFAAHYGKDKYGIVPDYTIEPAKTIHRLLGIGKKSFIYQEGNYLPYDLFIIDETSMVDVELMYSLLRAINHRSRVIFLGDKDQLASVAVGQVLSELCNDIQKTTFSRQQIDAFQLYIGNDFKLPQTTIDRKSQKSQFHESVVVLDKNYRFQDKQDIGLFTQAINKSDCQTILNILEKSSTVILQNSLEINTSFLQQWVETSWAGYFSATSPNELIQQRQKGQILCTTRNDVDLYNEKVAKLQGLTLLQDKKAVFAKQSFLIEQNLYHLGLFNGDTGVVFPGQDEKNRVWFTMANNQLQDFPLTILQHCTLSFAMTVHKSQGSEFDSVLLVFPSHKTNLLTKEWLYTGVSRAKNKVTIQATKEQIIEAVKTKNYRTSGLQERIWNI